MKQYILFAYYSRSANGGMDDMRGSFDTIQEAESYYNRHNWEEAQIVNRDTWEIEKIVSR